MSNLQEISNLFLGISSTLSLGGLITVIVFGTFTEATIIGSSTGLIIGSAATIPAAILTGGIVIGVATLAVLAGLACKYLLWSREKLILRLTSGVREKIIE